MEALENQLNNICHLIPEYHKARNPDCIREVQMTLEAMHAIASEITQRQKDVQAVAAPNRPAKARQVKGHVYGG